MKTLFFLIPILVVPVVVAQTSSNVPFVEPELVEMPTETIEVQVVADSSCHVGDCGDQCCEHCAGSCGCESVCNPSEGCGCTCGNLVLEGGDVVVDDDAAYPPGGGADTVVGSPDYSEPSVRGFGGGGGISAYGGAGWGIGFGGGVNGGGGGGGGRRGISFGGFGARGFRALPPLSRSH